MPSWSLLCRMFCPGSNPHDGILWSVQYLLDCLKSGLVGVNPVIYPTIFCSVLQLLWGEPPHDISTATLAWNLTIEWGKTKSRTGTTLYDHTGENGSWKQEEMDLDKKMELRGATLTSAGSLWHILHVSSPWRDVMKMGRTGTVFKTSHLLKAWTRRRILIFFSLGTFSWTLSVSYMVM